MIRSAPLLRMTPVLLLAGCVVNADKYPRPRDLTPDWKVTSLRLLAIQPEPPEARPGDDVTFTALFLNPTDNPGSTLWVACEPDAVSSFGCPVDFSAFDGEPTEEELREAGVIGIEPGFPPIFTIPDDALDDISQADRAEGVQFAAQAIALPRDGGQVNPDAELDFGTFETGYKRFIVSEASTPNNNPVIDAFLVDGTLVHADTVTEIDTGQRYELAIELPDSTIEEYEYVNPDGELELRVEEPFASWFSTEGKSLESTTLYPFTQSDWTAPDEPDFAGTWVAVVRDRRGGISWIERSWRTR